MAFNLTFKVRCRGWVLVKPSSGRRVRAALAPVPREPLAQRAACAASLVLLPARVRPEQPRCPDRARAPRLLLAASLPAHRGCVPLGQEESHLDTRTHTIFSAAGIWQWSLFPDDAGTMTNLSSLRIRCEIPYFPLPVP